MNIAIRYYTRGGNTEKLANSISSALQTPCASVDTPLTEKVDILFLGCSYYAFDMDEKVKRFIKENQDKIGSIACFGTSAMMKSMKKPMKKVLDGLEIRMLEDEFHCHGSFGPMHKGKPDENDLKAAQAFALRLADKK